jgi:putative transposase
MNLSRSLYYYKHRKDDSLVMNKLAELAEKHPDEGQDKYRSRICNEGLKWNRKRIRRVYLLMKLDKRKKAKKRLRARVKEPLVLPTAINQTWSMDFMSDALLSGRKFRTLNIIDDYNREALCTEPRFSISADILVQILARLVLEKGKPKRIRVDNGPEFISRVLKEWSEENGVILQFTQPGRPMQNGFIERFNRSYRTAVLNANHFIDLEQVRQLSDEFLDDYNSYRPHESLGNISPEQYRLKAQRV